MGGGKEEKEGKGDKGKVSCFCLQLKEFSINFSLETGTLLKKIFISICLLKESCHIASCHTQVLFMSFREKKRMSNSLVLLLFKGKKPSNT